MLLGRPTERQGGRGNERQDDRGLLETYEERGGALLNHKKVTQKAMNGL
jgi:hypothetical protein